MKKLKIGVLLDSKLLNRWSFNMLNEIIKSSHSEISLLIIKSNKSRNKSKSLLEKIKSKGFSFYSSIDKKINPIEKSCFDKIFFENELLIDELIVNIKETVHCDFFYEDDIKKIEKYDLDLLLRLGFRILKGDILKISKYGVWSFHHGDNDDYRGGPAAFWEIYDDRDLTGITLQVLSDKIDGGKVLTKGLYSTIKESYIKNKHNLYLRSESLLLKELNKLYLQGSINYFNNINSKQHSINFYNNRLYRLPNNFNSFLILVKNFFSRFKRFFNNKFFRKQWVLAFNFESSNSFSQALYKYKKIIPPKDRFWADPFPFEFNGKYFVFYEEFIYEKNKGTINVLELSKKGVDFNHKIILEHDYHMSYPFLFSHDDELYMIPESSKNKTVDLYKCVDFPEKWDFKMTLINDIEAVDSTILFYDNLFWIFCNVKNKNVLTNHDELNIFYSDKLFSNCWKRHINNPVKINAETSRPAGSFINFNNKIYRPSQDCAASYGSKININQIIDLNIDDYNESLMNKIIYNCEKKAINCHTINKYKDLSVIDLEIKKFKFF